MSDTPPITGPDGRVLFSAEELACPDTGRVKLAPGFAAALRDLRLDFKRPMIVTSCCRSAAYNGRIGGHPHSLHVWDTPHHDTGGTAAIDIAMTDARERRRLVACAITHGWSVGVAQTFLHLDRRGIAGLPAALFTYGDR